MSTLKAAQCRAIISSDKCRLYIPAAITNAQVARPLIVLPCIRKASCSEVTKDTDQVKQCTCLRYTYLSCFAIRTFKFVCSHPFRGHQRNDNYLCSLLYVDKTLLNEKFILKMCLNDILLHNIN